MSARRAAEGRYLFPNVLFVQVPAELLRYPQYEYSPNLYTCRIPASLSRGADALVAYKPVIGSPSHRANACLKVRQGEVMADGSTLVIKRTHIATRSLPPGQSDVSSFMQKPRGVTHKYHCYSARNGGCTSLANL